MTREELLDAMFAAWRADIDSVPFTHDNHWVGDQTTEVPR